MLNPFVNLIGSLLHLYMLCVLVWAALSMLISFKIVNNSQELVYRTMFVLNRMCNPAARYIRKFLPPIGGVDFSPIILLLLVNFLIDCLYTYFYNVHI